MREWLSRFFDATKHLYRRVCPYLRSYIRYPFSASNPLAAASCFGYVSELVHLRTKTEERMHREIYWWVTKKPYGTCRLGGFSITVSVWVVSICFFLFSSLVVACFSWTIFFGWISIYSHIRKWYRRWGCVSYILAFGTCRPPSTFIDKNGKCKVKRQNDREIDIQRQSERRRDGKNGNIGGRAYSWVWESWYRRFTLCQRRREGGHWGPSPGVWATGGPEGHLWWKKKKK